MLELVYAIAHDAATRPEKFRFNDPTADQATQGPGQSRGYASVRLGIRPGMDDDAAKGILIDEVYADTSAAGGGMKSGDTMTAWNGDPLETLGDLFEHLQSHKPGDKVKITVQRDGKTIVLDVELKAAE